MESLRLLEREQELRELRAALGAAKEGVGRIVLVEAPAGLGKTSLLAAACESAAETGFLCLRARATPLERGFAYGCMRQLLEPAIARAPEARRERLFAGAAARAKPLVDLDGSGERLPASDGGFAMLHGLYWLLDNLTDEGPLVLAVDGLHWTDAESLRFFNYLAPRLDGLPLALLASNRSGETAATELTLLAASPEATVLRPRPLSTGATATLCRARLGGEVAPGFVRACREVTGGNPYLLEELLREVAHRGLAPDSRGAAQVCGIGPAAVADAVLVRLADQPASATRLVRAVAVLGDGASPREAARLAGLEEQAAAQAADLLAALAILRRADGLEFAHPIVREAVYATIGPNERARAHAYAAGVLGSEGAADERIAAQIMEADPAGDPDRVELLRRVAADGLARGAPAAPVALLARALAEPPPAARRAEVLLELGSAELRLGTPTATEHLAAATELIREPGPLATAARSLALALTLSKRSSAAVEVLEAAIVHVEPSDRELALVLEAELQAHAQQASLRVREMAAKRLERHAGLRGESPGERLVLASLAFEHARRSESAGEAAAHLERGLAGGRLLAEQELDVTGPFYHLLVGLLSTDEIELVEVSVEQALAQARARGSIPALAYALAYRAWASLRRGAVAQAEDDARAALELLTEHRISFGAGELQGILALALVERGEPEAAEGCVNAGMQGEEIPPGLTSNVLLEARALLRLDRGAREGLDDLLELGRRDEEWGGANPLASRWRSRAALALAALGERERALRLVCEDLERANRWGTRSGIGIALRAAGLVEGGPALVPRLHEAVASLERSPARLEHARTLVDLGAARRRGGGRTEARELLQEARDIAHRCGARPLAERAHTELRAAGGPSGDPYRTGVEQLTVSERRVAELASNGLSNPEIAQTLFVTRKTVETHLGRVYRKLGIQGRGQLSGTLADRGGRSAEPASSEILDRARG